MRNFISRMLSFQFVKFCVTGGLGLITDMAVFSILKSFFQPESKIILNIIPLFGYAIAMTQNYLINHYWTFGKQTAETSISKRAYFGFFAVSLTALMPRYIAYNAFLSYFGKSGIYPHIANFSGILVATLFNFIGSKYFVFIGKKK